VSELEVTRDENRRLRKENAELRQRVAAFDSSRWWRLHPRLRLRDLERRVAAAVPRAEHRTPAEEADPTASSDLLARFRAEVTSRGTFTADWFTRNTRRWEPILRGLEGEPSRILEIGSFEGLSACYLLWRLPEARLTCVDTFEGSAEHVAYGDVPPDLEDRFTRNVAVVDATRVRTVRGDSRRVLLDLVGAGERFDLVYVDGSHLALDVLVDAALSWQVLERGGVLIFDDYDWSNMGQDALLRPGPAIDAVLDILADHSEPLFRNGQVALRKLG
jgi:predicted O-methyltransferase YrrM